jgi:hypothetical protein
MEGRFEGVEEQKNRVGWVSCAAVKEVDSIDLHEWPETLGTCLISED